MTSILFISLFYNINFSELQRFLLQYKFTSEDVNDVISALPSLIDKETQIYFCMIVASLKIARNDDLQKSSDIFRMIENVLMNFGKSSQKFQKSSENVRKSSKNCY